MRDHPGNSRGGGEEGTPGRHRRDLPSGSGGNRAAAFEDHFSKQARAYALYRPRYPEELFAYLAAIAPRRRLAWDCGTGNGQAAVGLAAHFDRVLATDASADQLGLAVPHPRVEYRAGRAEATHPEAGSTDLVTVAVAVHWFDFDAFYAAVRRAASPGGVIAVWTYHLPSVSPAVDALLARYLTDVLSGYWPERFRYVADRYRTIPFPFGEIVPPEFTMQTSWTLGELRGFLESWSATRRYLEERGEQPLDVIGGDLEIAWGDARRTRPVRWTIHLRVGSIGEG